MNTNSTANNSLQLLAKTFLSKPSSKTFKTSENNN